MSADDKLKGTAPGKPKSELTRLKEAWLRTLSDEARVYWREQFCSSRTQSDIRSEIFKKLKINLREDNQLTFFRQWLGEQDIRDKEAEAVQRDEVDLDSQGLKGEDLRRELIDRMTRRALARGDFKLGGNAVKLGQREEIVAIDKGKLALLQKKSDAYDRAQAALTSAKQSKGGITKETLTQIERELKLL